jgi:GNAT superfamily N-acetyltransferase
MKILFINDILTEGEILDNTQFKISQQSNDEFLIKAIYKNQEIGHLNLDIMHDMYDYFMGDYTEDEYYKLFPNNIGVFISEVKSHGFRGEGIARKLMEMAIQKTKQLGLNRLYLNASPIKDADINSSSGQPLQLNQLVKFYESFGFKKLKGGPNNTEMLLIMNPINENKNTIKNILRENRELGQSLANQMSTPYITIYRAAPLEANEFYDRDYVTLSKKFAIEHAENNHVYNETPFHVIRTLVPTKNVFDASNPSEYFYSGPNKKGTEIYITKGPFDYEGYDDNMIEEGELVNNTKFKISKQDDEYTIQAIYNNETIGQIMMDLIFNTEQYFEDELSPEFIEQNLQEPLFTIQWLEVPDDYYKGAGVGRALMNKAIDKAQQLKFKQIYLNASPIGHSGLNINDLTKWYETFGFKTILKQGHNNLMLLNMK